MNKTLLSILVTAVVIGGASFYGGMKYSQSAAVASFRQGGGGGNRQFAGGGLRSGTGGGMRGDVAAGEILSKDDKSVTVKLRDGGSKIIFLSGSIEVSKFVQGSAGDLSVGDTVVINGKQNQDGSLTAETIQLRPNMSVNTNK